MRLQQTVFLCLVASTTSLRAVEFEPIERPNIIVIFTDDHGYADLRCQGVLDDLKTPHTDALAASGVRMTNGYVTAPQCVPSRCGLLTGRYQTELGVESNGAFNLPGGLNGFDLATTIPERLKTAGYATGMAGKWHLGPENQIVSHGFDHAFPKNSSRPPIANITATGRDQPLGPSETKEYHLDACSGVACAFIERYRSRPFFFYLAYRAPHVPLDPPQQYLDRFPGEMPERRRKALAMISAVDDGVGRITDTLKRLKLTEKTLIFYISDNGAPLKIHKRDEPGSGAGWDGSLNEPLNGEKGMLTEGGIRTPFVVSWPGTIPKGGAYHQPVISLDVAATANAVAGLEPDPLLDGVNLVPFLTGVDPGVPHELLFWRWEGQAAIRRGEWKYLEGGGRRYLFQLTSDVGETRNLADQQPDRVAQMRAELMAWSQTQQPPGLKDSLSTAGQKYFDWYLDGVRSEAAESDPQSQPAMRQKPDTPERNVSPRELFTRRDTDKNGEVTLDEFLAGRDGDKRPPLERRFKSLDRNRDGVWTVSELKD